MGMGNLQVDPSEFDMVECVTELAESFAPIYDQNRRNCISPLPLARR
jgi:hypothetical protein